MPAINGKQYIDRIDRLNANIWYKGEKVNGKLSLHPAFKGVIATQAKLFDLQHDPKTKDLLTYSSETTGEPVATAFLPPKTKEDLEKRRHAFQELARQSAGMLGRSPDYMNTALMAFGTAADFLRGQDDRAANNMKAYYDLVRENDLTLTHTFIVPQVNRSSFYIEEREDIIGARMIEQNSDGIVIHGARLLATQGATTDEIIVFPSGARLPLVKASEELAYAFAIPNNTPGLKFYCRESWVGGESTFDHPLSSRFEEMDTIVVFDHVLVPWDRVFIHGNIDVNNNLYNASDFFSHATHQVICKNIVKVEFMLGVAQSIVNTIRIGEYQHVQEKVAEIIVALEALRGFVLSSEQSAKINRWGVLTPDPDPLAAATIYFPKIYPRINEIIQLLGASGLVSIPTEADFASSGGDDLRHYLQTSTGDGEEKVRLFRLAWDLTMSAFGSRQELYERFFFGDPVRLASNLFRNYNSDIYLDRVKHFLSDQEK